MQCERFWSLLGPLVVGNLSLWKVFKKKEGPLCVFWIIDGPVDLSFFRVPNFGANEWFDETGHVKISNTAKFHLTFPPKYSCIQRHERNTKWEGKPCFLEIPWNWPCSSSSKELQSICTSKNCTYVCFAQMTLIYKLISKWHPSFTLSKTWNSQGTSPFRVFQAMWTNLDAKDTNVGGRVSFWLRNPRSVSTSISVTQ